MKLHIVKALGTFHGLFGIFVLVFLWASYSQGFFDDIGIGHTVLKVTGSAVGAILLVLCMWASWRNPALAALYAWLSLATFVVTASGDELYLHGVQGFSNLISTFYVAVAVRAAAALSIGLLVKNAMSATDAA